jgi:hypothetical protein
MLIIFLKKLRVNGLDVLSAGYSVGDEEEKSDSISILSTRKWNHIDILEGTRNDGRLM